MGRLARFIRFYTDEDEGNKPVPFDWDTVTGVSPLLLSDALAKPIKSLTQTGKCTQSGTPTPSSPVDIMCNNGKLVARRASGLPVRYKPVEWLKATQPTDVGIKTKRSFDIYAKVYREGTVAQYIYQSDSGASLTTNTTAYTSAGGANWRFGNRTVNVTLPVEEIVETRQNRGGVWANGEQLDTYSSVNAFTSENNLSIAGATSGGVPPTLRIFYVRAFEGETLVLDCIPVYDLVDEVYGWYDKVAGEFYTNPDATYTAGADVADPVGIYADGEDEVLTVCGKNLLDTAHPYKTGYSINASGVETETSSHAIYIIPAKAGETYTYSCTYSTGSSTTRIHTYDADGNWIKQETAGAQNATKTFTAPANTAEIRVSMAVSAADTAQVEHGSNATDFSAYTAQTVTDIPMLLSTGNYADEAELIGGIKTGKCGVYIINGTEVTTTYSVTQGQLFRIRIPSDYAIPNSKVGLFCTHFVGVANTDRTNGTMSGSTASNLDFINDNLSTADDWKAWVAAELAAGHPVMVILPLATETTEQTTAHSLNTTEGGNTITVVANVSGINLEAIYAVKAS